MKSWIVVVVALALLFLVYLVVAIGLDWFVDVFWPWSGIGLLTVSLTVTAWVGRRWLRTRDIRKRFREELLRIGVDSTVVDVSADGSVWIAGGAQDGPPEHTWDGSAAGALRRLSSVADRGGFTEFWEVFPERETVDNALS